MHLTDSPLNILHNPFLICHIIIHLAKLCCQLHKLRQQSLYLCMRDQLLYSQQAKLSITESERRRVGI